MASLMKVGSHKTSIRTIEGVTSIRYHDTDVVSFDDKTITLNTGGWKTNTTKTRMNQVSNQFELGYCVYQRKGIWYVAFKGYDLLMSNDGKITLER